MEVVRQYCSHTQGQAMSKSQLLKKDLFGEVRFISGPNGGTIVRDTSMVRPWLGWLARALMRREGAALALLDGLPGVPELLEMTPNRLARSYIDGQPMQQARPRDPEYFRRARRLLHSLHRAGVLHNDLAKEPNLLVTAVGDPAMIDFQLAWAPARRGSIFRALAFEDLRHLLKHKRTYCPQSLTARERHILENPSWPSRVWMNTGKPVYLFITRRLLGWSDREGSSDRGAQSD
jgi:RIO-like serine/threonine protein kinase